MNDACSAPVTTSQRFQPVSRGQSRSHERAEGIPGLKFDCLPRNRKGRESSAYGTDSLVRPSMSIPARSRVSVTMAGSVLAPPAEWPAIATRDGSISEAPFHCGRDLVSSSTTNDTSAARPRPSFSQNASVRSGRSQAAQVVTRPSGKVVATLS